MASKSPYDIALESDIPPNTKSDNQWCKHHGYHGGLYNFAIAYGFQTYGPDYEEARRLVNEFRNEQQEAWEALRLAEKAKKAYFVFESNKRKRADENSEPKKRKVKRSKERSEEHKERVALEKHYDKIHSAMKVHRRWDHAVYESVLKAAKCELKRGVPNLNGLKLRDLPACKVCERMGRDPWKSGAKTRKVAKGRSQAKKRKRSKERSEEHKERVALEKHYDKIHCAMKIHRGWSHAPYESVLMAPKNEMVKGVPNLDGLKLEDFPTCRTCKREGRDPWKPVPVEYTGIAILLP